MGRGSWVVGDVCDQGPGTGTAVSREPVAVSPSPKAESRKPKAESRKPKGSLT